jgi:hypothetical protein
MGTTVTGPERITAAHAAQLLDEMALREDIPEECTPGGGCGPGEDLVGLLEEQLTTDYDVKTAYALMVFAYREGRRR